jgi:hypothetical protein
MHRDSGHLFFLFSVHRFLGSYLVLFDFMMPVNLMTSACLAPLADFVGI